MVNRSSLAALALAGLLVLAGCSGLSADGTPRADPGSTVQSSGDGATVAVGGRGSVSAEPDAATVRLTVIARGDDPETVRDRLGRNATAAREALLAYGLEESQIRSAAFEIRENYRGRHEGDEDAPALVGTHRLVVELNDTDRVGPVIAAAVDRAHVRVDGVRFRLSDQRREQLRDEALTEAVADARSEAELVAGAESLRVTGAERIATDRVDVENSEGTIVRAYDARATETSDGADTRVESGEVTVTASVTVVYNATAVDG